LPAELPLNVLTEVALMSGKFTLSKPIFENLVLHLVNIENEKEELVNGLFPKPSMERIKFRRFWDDYITGIDFMIRYRVDVGEKSDSSFPVIIVNCSTEVLDLKTKETVSYRIVSPYDKMKTGDVSFLSPIGRSLLLKEVGDEVAISTPEGKHKYRVQSIRLTSINT
jgi:transcription elongation factor GreA